MSNAFYSILYDIFDRFVPTYRFYSNPKRGKKNYPSSLKRLMQRKLAVWRTLKSNFSPELAEKYRRLCKQVRDGLKNADSRFEASLIRTGNLGRFYRYTGSKINNKRNVGPVLSNGSELVHDAKDKAELLSEYFRSVFVTDDNRTSDVTYPTTVEDGNLDTLTEVHFTSLAVSRVLRKLKSNSAGGPDLVPPIFLKNCCTYLSYPLSRIFNSFFQSRLFAF